MLQSKLFFHTFYPHILPNTFRDVTVIFILLLLFCLICIWNICPLGHVQRRDPGYIRRRVLKMELPGKGKRGRPKRRCMDMEWVVGVTVGDVENRKRWKQFESSHKRRKSITCHSLFSFKHNHRGSTCFSPFISQLTVLQILYFRNAHVFSLPSQAYTGFY